MRFILFVARRYFFSRNFGNAINIITLVAVLGIGVCTAALILVLSVFNGLTNFIEDLFSAMDPDIKVVATIGQYMTEDESMVNRLLEVDGVVAVTRTIEGKVVLDYVDNQAIAVLKGVEQDFNNVNQIDTFVYEGNYDFAERNNIPQAIFGNGVAAKLKANILNEVEPVRVLYIPQESNLTNPNAIKTDFLFPSGFFSVQLEYDEKYVISDFETVRDILDSRDKLSAYEIRLENIDDAEKVREEISSLLGEDYKVLTWFEQHSTLYRVMRNEKYISYLILVLMLSIAAVNIVGSLSMIVIEKVHDIAVLKSFGASDRLISKIFQVEGILVGGAGALFGVIIATTLGLLQQYYGLVKLEGGDSFRVKAFPIALEWGDYVLVILTVTILSYLAGIYPSRVASRTKVVDGLRR
ncbi:MAG: ABC transporter permease [Bacteroidota bacterium]